jgi:hypothetical protein
MVNAGADPDVDDAEVIDAAAAALLAQIGRIMHEHLDHQRCDRSCRHFDVEVPSANSNFA